MNNFLALALQEMRPPRKGRFTAKFKFAAQKGNFPLQIALHGNSLIAEVSESYFRYLANRLREFFELVYIPSVLNCIQKLIPLTPEAKNANQKLVLYISNISQK